jgi:hypothetical protein
MVIWIIATAIVIALGRQFYMSVDQVEKKSAFRVRIFISEAIATSLTLTILYYIVKWIIGLF